MATWKDARRDAKPGRTIKRRRPVDAEKVEKKTVEKEPVKKKAPSWRKPEQEKPKKNANINNTPEFDVNKTYLVVNGKAKEISNKSKYLLDMLIINQED